MSEYPGDARFATEEESRRKLQTQLETARKAFRARARAIMWNSYQDADQLSGAIGVISVAEAWDAWVKKLKETLDVS